MPAFVAILLAPLLGGWQRLDRNYLSAWKSHGWDLPPELLGILPMGDAPAQAHATNRLLGGGSGAEVFGIAAIDPVAGLLALLATPEVYLGVLVAWAIPVALALVAGRIYCGWMCPFGCLARGLAGLLERLPWRVGSYAAPRHRWLRFVVLSVALLLGATGGQLALVLLLPHLLVQQTIYAMWLMGGGGAALGALAGLLVVGIMLGPTVYCAAVCPTGAALSLPGRHRRVRLAVVQPSACGARCDLCDRACWLHLHPSEGEPGADCDNCARCVAVCPRDNLRIYLGRRRMPRAAAAVVALVTWLGAAAGAQATPDDEHKPGLMLEATREVGPARMHISVVDLHGVRMDADDERRLRGAEVSVYVVRGPRGEPDQRGRLPTREYYHGPLVIRVRGDDGLDSSVSFDEPNYPLSTPRRSIYRARFDTALRPGDEVIVEDVPRWAPTQQWTLPVPNAARGGWRTLSYALVALLLFGGLTALTLSSGNRRSRGAARRR